MGWTGEAFRRMDLGDKRLDKRAALLLAERLASQPTACGPTKGEH